MKQIPGILLLVVYVFVIIGGLVVFVGCFAWCDQYFDAIPFLGGILSLFAAAFLCCIPILSPWLAWTMLEGSKIPEAVLIPFLVGFGLLQAIYAVLSLAPRD